MGHASPPRWAVWGQVRAGQCRRPQTSACPPDRHLPVPLSQHRWLGPGPDRGHSWCGASAPAHPASSAHVASRPLRSVSPSVGGPQRAFLTAGGQVREPRTGNAHPLACSGVCSRSRGPDECPGRVPWTGVLVGTQEVSPSLREGTRT